MKQSQKNMYPHSEVKVRLLHLYLERYLNILTNSPFVGDVHLYDLFCGEGIYENGGKGSPVVMLETVRDVCLLSKSRGQKASKFTCRFNDYEKGKVDKVREYASAYGLNQDDICRVDFSAKDYRIVLEEVIEEVNTFKNKKGFIFIDPYGYKDIKVSDIHRLLDNGNTEVLLFLPTQFMFRFENKGTPESLKVFIDELMPTTIWPYSETGIEFIENLTGAFREALGAKHFVDSFIITRDKNQFFCLFFFTSHIYGFDRMLDAKWKIDEEEGRGWQNPVQDLFSQMDKKPNTVKFERQLKKLLANPTTNGELYEFTLHQGHLHSHTNEILERWQNEGLLLCMQKNGQAVRRGAFYLNYPNWKENPARITIKLKQ